MGLSLHINGRTRVLNAESGATLQQVLDELELRGDRIAVEVNGRIVPRTGWGDNVVSDGDRLEIVHFVGGGNA